MSDLRRHRHPPKISQTSSPLLYQSRRQFSSNVSLRFADQNRYEKFITGSRWKNFILPQFVQDEYQNEDCQSTSSKGTFSRVEESRARTFTDVEGFNPTLPKSYNHTPEQRVLRSRNSSKQNIFVNGGHPEISAFSLKKNRANTQFWSNTQSQFDRFQKQSFSSISKPYSIRNQEEMCSVGVQTEEEVFKLTQEEVECLKEQLDYLRKFVFSSFEDSFKKVKDGMETPKREGGY